MGLSDMINRAKDIVQKRGGTDALKEDAQELKDVARSDAKMSDKVKEGVEAIKEPGAKRPGQEPGAERPGQEPEAKRPGQEPEAKRPGQ
jgi:hypothetical protein